MKPWSQPNDHPSQSLRDTYRKVARLHVHTDIRHFLCILLKVLGLPGFIYVLLSLITPFDKHRDWQGLAKSSYKPGFAFWDHWVALQTENIQATHNKGFLEEKCSRKDWAEANTSAGSEWPGPASSLIAAPQLAVREERDEIQQREIRGDVGSPNS